MYELPEDLVVRAKEGEEMAFNQIYELIYLRIYHLAYYILQNEADSKDVVGDTMLHVCESIHKLRDSKACYGWICKILVNECKKKIKHYKKRETSLTDVEPVLAYYKDFTEMTDIRLALEKLTYEERMIVIMRVVQGYRGEEIAKVLHLKHSTVRSKYRRSIAKLQNFMKGEDVQ